MPKRAPYLHRLPSYRSFAEPIEGSHFRIDEPRTHFFGHHTRTTPHCCAGTVQNRIRCDRLRGLDLRRRTEVLRQHGTTEFATAKSKGFRKLGFGKVGDPLKAKFDLMPAPEDDWKTCPLCGRPIPPDLESRHHLIPKLKGGKHGPIAVLHTICHGKIHSVLTEAELARDYDTVEKLLEHEEIAHFVRWVRKRPPEFRSRNYGNHRRS